MTVILMHGDTEIDTWSLKVVLETSVNFSPVHVLEDRKIHAFMMKQIEAN